MAEKKLLFGGSVVGQEGVERADVLVEGERIATVGPNLAADESDAQKINVTGLTLLPGLIDAHVHLREPGGEHKEDFHTGTCAALAGGVTTVLAMPNTNPPITDQAALDDILNRAASKAVCDFDLYLGGTADNIEEARSLADQVAGLKLYVGSSTGSLLVDHLPAQIQHFERFPREAIIAAHAEDEAAVRYYASLGQRRPPICAALSVAHLLTLAEQIGRRLHVCHVSTGAELALIRDAKHRGVQVTCEATPHHLFLSTEDEIELGALGRVNPPLRSAKDIDALWENLDVIDLIATDHAPHTVEEKESDTPPSGMPGLETMLPLLLTAYHDNRLTLPDIAQMTSTRPAKVFGIEDRGEIAPGYFADLTLVDLAETWQISNESLFTRCGWSPFAGRQARGKVRQVYLRGELVFDQGKVIAAPGYGRNIKSSR
ncbi:MAG: dihydroorotase family protein [Anaerolineae bacterium]|nr:dihydroorotase family protein [Anaerolineae bacterium]